MTNIMVQKIQLPEVAMLDDISGIGYSVLIFSSCHKIKHPPPPPPPRCFVPENKMDRDDDNWHFISSITITVKQM